MPFGTLSILRELGSLAYRRALSLASCNLDGGNLVFAYHFLSLCDEGNRNLRGLLALAHF